MYKQLIVSNLYITVTKTRFNVRGVFIKHVYPSQMHMDAAKQVLRTILLEGYDVIRVVLQEKKK